METIEEVAISGDFSAGHTFSGLDGNADGVYKVEFVGGAPQNMNVQLNGDTGTNYHYQVLVGVTSSAVAGSTTLAHFRLVDNGSSVVSPHMWIYTKSGQNRPALSEYQNGENSVSKRAHWWNNTSDNITSIKVFAEGVSVVTGTLRLSKVIIGNRIITN
jgi:hypothetical protein